MENSPFRKTCDLPTGLGKTSIITIWLLALAHRARANTLIGFPRRLIYVVNRRTVVDQATREAEKLRKVLIEKPEVATVVEALNSLALRATDSPLAISTLRGQFADNAEWRENPARPAVIVGTVDMIGSRLLFSGYGPGFKSRPLHAGFLGQDALVVHDEAHLEPAFQQLLEAIASEQKRSHEFATFHVIALTATARTNGADRALLSDRDHLNGEVSRRLNAKKSIEFHPIAEEKDIANKIVECTLAHEDSGQAILIFLRKLKDVKTVSDRLPKRQLRTLTGTLRGLERDQLAAHDPIFARFVHASSTTPQTGTVYLICTSAGEVGIDMSADHLVCDLTPFDSMAQRFGRVNRFGTGDARIDLVYVRTDANHESGGGKAGTSKLKANKKSERYERARELTLVLLQRLPRDTGQRFLASPSALSALPADERLAAFTPEPTILPATEILFDAWALTSIRERLPGRPPVADWLHGVAEWEPPDTYIAWREEVGLIAGELLDRYKPEDLLEDYPLKPHEQLRDQTSRIFEELEALVSRKPTSPVWIIEDYDTVTVKTLADLIDMGEDAIANKTVVLPPSAGGLRDGALHSGAEFKEEETYDVADLWLDSDGKPRRCRVWDAGPPDRQMRLVRTIDTLPEIDEFADGEPLAARRYWRWYVRPRSADDDGSRSARQPQALIPHLESAEGFAKAIVDKLALAEPEATAVRLAAKWHDLGKHRRVWQRSIGNRDYPGEVLAKSGGRMRALDLNNYRHEFGSLIDVATCAEFQELDEHTRNLVLHLIAAHHGRARPHFPANEAFDLERPPDKAAGVAREVPQRFARLQRRYGRWGLAYLESLLRAADVLASQANDGSEAEPSAAALAEKGDAR